MSLVLPGVRAALTPQWVRHPLWQIARQVPAFHLDFTTGQAIERIGGRLGTFTRPSSVKNVWNGSQFVEVAADVPALQRDPATGLWGYLHEPAAANLVVNSIAFNGAGWTTTNASVSADVTATTAPDGTQTADKLIENTVNGNHEVIFTFTPAVNTAHTWSCFVKAAELSSCVLRYNVGLNGVAQIGSFTLSGAGTATAIGGTPSPAVQFMGDGWYRCSITATSSASPGSTQVTLATRLGAVGLVDSGVFAWGAQLETGPIATSPIITTGSAVTRAVDTWTWTGAQFSDWYQQAGGVFVFRGIYLRQIGFPGFASWSDGTNSNRIQVAGVGLNRRAVVTSGGATQYDAPAASLGANVIGQPFALAMRATAANFVSAANGGNTHQQLSGSVPSTLNQLRLGADGAGANVADTLIRDVLYFPPSPAADRIQALSAL